MTTEMQRKLDRLKNRRTLYELAAIHQDGRRVLIAYCASRSRSTLYGALSDAKRYDAVISLFGGNGITFGKYAKDGAVMGEWAIRFTGRTKRDSILEGELPYVCELMKGEDNAISQAQK